VCVCVWFSKRNAPTRLVMVDRPRLIQSLRRCYPASYREKSA